MQLAAGWKVDRNVSEEGAGTPGGADALRQELEQLRERMAAIKQGVADEVDEKWGSPFRSKDVFDLKVQARLSSNDEYQKLRARVQEAEARLAADSGAAGG
jgi:BMFP domain-containing protein YqiC